RMKLNSFDRILTVPQSHYQPVRRRSRHLEYIGQAFLFDDEGVIACRLKSVRQATKDCHGVVTDLGCLAVHKSLGANYTPAECFANRLVPKTNAKYRNLFGKCANNRDTYARVRGHAGPGRNHDPLGFQFADLIHRDRVVAIDLRISAKLAQILDQVVGKGIVIVDDQDHIQWSVSEKSAVLYGRSSVAAPPSIKRFLTKGRPR